MSSSSNKRQTMAKIARERTLREKRALKAERKAERKLAAATADENGGVSVESDLDVDADIDSAAVESADPALP